MVDNKDLLMNHDAFSAALFEKMKQVNYGLTDLELYEFQYALESIIPADGWDSLSLKKTYEIEQQISSLSFYQSIEVKPVVNGKIQLDPEIRILTQMLFVGLVTGEYTVPWIENWFTFDIRGFYFLHPTSYFDVNVLNIFGNTPYRTFPAHQKKFFGYTALGYKDFREANHDLDQFFIECVLAIAGIKGTPILLGIAGPTAAGKTEITAQLRDRFQQIGKNTCTLEMDHFLTDRDYREQHGIDSLGKEALHYNLLIKCLGELRQGKTIHIPQYDFVAATSTHDLAGHLKPGASTFTIEPADIIFIEGNFPFLYPEMKKIIDVKAVYLTDDHIRMLRKWRRDIDLRKKYDLNYFRNRYFREQFIMAKAVYSPQMAVSDFIIDTTGGTFWASPAMQKLLPGNAK